MTSTRSGYDNHHNIGGPDLLSHSRENQIHILTLDHVLATDVAERLQYDGRFENYDLRMPASPSPRTALSQVEKLAKETTSSRAIILDIRKQTLSSLNSIYRDILSQNRGNLNRTCYVVLIGEGPHDLFRTDKGYKAFATHISRHRADYPHSAFFFDPFIHFEPGELAPRSVETYLEIPAHIPGRFMGSEKILTNNGPLKVNDVRKYFRATGKSDAEKEKRQKNLTGLFRKRIKESFPGHAEELEAMLTREGMAIGGEHFHLYPLFFEDIVHNMVANGIRR